MGWIAVILKNLPALLAALQTLISIFTTQAAMKAHASISTAMAAGNAAASDQWNWYVLGQGGLSAALGVGAVGCVLMQPTMNRVFASHLLLERNRQMRELEERLSAEIESLPAGMQAKLAARAGQPRS